MPNNGASRGNGPARKTGGSTYAYRPSVAPEMTLREIADLLADRLVDLYRPSDGRRSALRTQPPFAASPHRQELLLFYEYVRADTGQRLGASHPAGWTGFVANLVMRRYRKDIPEFWSRQSATAEDDRQRPELRAA